jgi:hypothetical protein
MIEQLKRRLAELRAVRGRIDQRQLEADDWAVLGALLSKELERAEPGCESLIIEFSDEDDASGGVAGGEVAAADSTSELESKGDASDGSRRPKRRAE